MGKLWPIGVEWPEWSRVLGWILFTVPYLLAIWGVFTFRRHQTPVDPRGNVAKIVSSGPFRFTRNPMYLTLMIVYIGGVLAFRLVWGALWLIPLFLSLQYGVIGPEERYLNAKFGDEYIRYTRRVRRWI
jgi:protein-S-isoprenylcysteine O-methyltransferase Ste14